MESIGEKLTKARTGKGYSLEQVARDTHISRQYIEALEQERFDAFPGETYLLGFIRKYADFLDVDGQEMVNLYKNQQLQEQPAPIQELLNPRPRISGRTVAIAVGALTAAVAIGFAVLVYSGVVSLPERPERSAETEGGSETTDTRRGQVVHLTQNLLEQRFYPGDAVSVPVDGDSYLLEIGLDREAVELTNGVGTRRLGYADEALIDMTGDERADIRVQVVDANPRADGRVTLRIDRSFEGPERIAERPGSNLDTAAAAEPVGSTQLESRQRRIQLLREAESAEPLRLVVTGGEVPVPVRLLSDDGEQTAAVLSQGDRLQVEGREFVQLYTANAGEIQATLNGESLELGSSGEIAVVRYAWDNLFGSGSARLEQVPVY